MFSFPLFFSFFLYINIITILFFSDLFFLSSLQPIVDVSLQLLLLLFLLFLLLLFLLLLFLLLLFLLLSDLLLLVLLALFSFSNEFHSNLGRLFFLLAATGHIRFGFLFDQLPAYYSAVA